MVIVFDGDPEEVSSSRPIYVLPLSYQLPSQCSMYTVSACASDLSSYLVYLPNLGARVRGPYTGLLAPRARTRRLLVGKPIRSVIKSEIEAIHAHIHIRLSSHICLPSHIRISTFILGEVLLHCPHVCATALVSLIS